MSLIQIQNLSFSYSNPYRIIFNDFDLSLDTSWKTGVVGSNGRGKSTLLKLLAGLLEPAAGKIAIPLKTSYFPYALETAHKKVKAVIRDSIAPFSLWEKEMEKLIVSGSETDLASYGEILDLYNDADGFEMDGFIEKEVSLMGLDTEILERDFHTLSGGEQTRCFICALFLKKNSFALLDEPTNHLDLSGRETLANYLSRKHGFILVSHDRSFLDHCTDHILALEKKSTSIFKGNFTQWKEEKERREESELHRKENLERQINQLKKASLERREWSNKAESAKMSKKEAGGTIDKGYLGAVSARLMKRARNIESRYENKINEKTSLLKDWEKKRKLKLDEDKKLPDVLLRVSHVRISIGNKVIVPDFSLTLEKGMRVALTGKNGCGKTTLFRAIIGELSVDEGSIHIPSQVRPDYVSQKGSWRKGVLNELIQQNGLDSDRFRNILACMGLKGDILDKEIAGFSEGEKKKIELCRSFVKPASFLLWDEPLNTIDLYSREQLEEVILEHEPTMLFIEHDRFFIDRLATEIITLK